MAIVFVSPAHRQKMFFWGIAIAFLMVLVIIALFVFLQKPKAVPVELVFQKPKIEIDFKVLEAQQKGVSEIFLGKELEFGYQATSEQGTVLSGKVSAPTEEEALKILEAKKYTNITLQKPAMGRENPFVPYYTIVETVAAKKTK